MTPGGGMGLTVPSEPSVVSRPSKWTTIATGSLLNGHGAVSALKMDDDHKWTIDECA